MVSLDDDFAQAAAKGLVTLLWNQICREYGEPWLEFTSSERGRRSIVANTILESARAGQVLLPPVSPLTTEQFLAAFVELSRDAENELMAFATTEDASSDRVVVLGANRGTSDSVAVPHYYYQMVSKRLGRNERFKCLSVHNHPNSFLHALFQAATIGPSSADRDLMLNEYVRALSRGRLMVPQWYVWEKERLIKIRFPSWEVVVAVLRAVSR